MIDDLLDDTPTPAHSDWSASGYYRWSVCHRSVAFNRGREEKSSDFAKEGTRAHELLEEFLALTIENNWTYSPKIALRKIEISKPFTRAKELKEFNDMMTAIRETIDFVGAIAGKTGRVFLEHRFDLSWLRPGMFGTCDVIVLVGRELHVIDFKYGAGIPVRAKENGQMSVYGLAALNDFDHEHDFDTVVLHIAQPRKNNFDTWRTTPDYLREFAATAGQAYDATLIEDAPFTAGEHCDWCPSREHCPELIRETLKVVNNGQQYDLRVRDLFSDDLLAMQTIKVVRIWAKARESQIKEKLLRGEPSNARELFKISKGRATRQWKDELKMPSAFIYELNPEFYTVPQFKSPAQVEKACKEIDVDFSETFSGHIMKKQSAPTITSIDDDRPAYDADVDAFAEFAAMDVIEQQNLPDDLLG